MQGVVLAGGGSRRLGREKPLLPLGDRTLIERVIQALAPVTERILVVTNQPELYNFLGRPLVGDLQAGRGPLAGIETGLVVGGRGLFVAADYPFLNAGLLAHLVRVAEGYQAAVPRLNGHWEPLVGVYDPSLLPNIRRELAGEGRVAAILSEAVVRSVEAAEVALYGLPERLFFNINTDADWELARYLPDGGGKGRF